MFIKRGILLLTLIAVCLIPSSNAYSQSAQSHYNKAKEFISKGLYDKAIEELNQAIQKRPRVPMYYKTRGQLYRNKSELGPAISDYSKAIELNPGDAEVYYFRAISYYFTKQYDSAWKDVKRAKDLGYQIPDFFIDDLKKASGEKVYFR